MESICIVKTEENPAETPESPNENVDTAETAVIRCERIDEAKENNDMEKEKGPEASVDENIKTEDATDEAPGEGSDPYAYLQREGFTSELYKLEIKNLPKYFGAGQLKKFFANIGIHVHKMKLLKSFCFASFRSLKERDDAFEKLNNNVKFKGNVLYAKVAQPMQDPLLKKRKAEEDNENEAEKKAKVEEPIAEQVKKKAMAYGGIPYPVQLEQKKKAMIRVLEKMSKEISKVNYQIGPEIRRLMSKNNRIICPFGDVIPSPCKEKYRNKCEFTIGTNPDTDELTVGFRVSSYRQGSCAVGPINDMTFIPDSMREAVRVFESHFKASNLKAFNPIDHSGFWKQLLVRSNLAGEVMVVVGVNPTEELQPVKEELKKLAASNNIASLYFQLMAKKEAGEHPSALHMEHLFGATNLKEKLCNLEFSISPEAFFQVNTLAAEVLYHKIAEIAEIDADTNVLDICCGTGTIGLCLSNKCKNVYGVELVANAVEDAKRNAEKNSITNCVFVAGKAEDELGNLIKQIDTEGKVSKIVAVLDPPRAGLHRRGCQVLRNTKEIERVIYVACNAETAMKSIVDFCRAESKTYGGIPFIPTKAFAIDLFPDTPHCELVLLLERYKPSA